MSQALAFVSQWLDHLKTRTPYSDVAPGEPVEHTTEVSYRSKLALFTRWAAGRPVSMALLREYVEYLQFEAPSKHGAGLRPRTIKASVQPLTGYLAWARELHGAAVPELAELPERIWLKLPPLDRASRPKPTREEVDALFRAAETMDDFSERDRFLRARALALLSLAIDCGARRNEILTLDLAHVRTDAEPWSIDIHHAKGNKFRSVPLNARARKHLEQYLEQRRLWTAGAPARRRNPALFPVDARRKIDEDTLSELRHRLLHRASMDGKYHMHSFRHYRIKEWLGVNGVNPKSVAELAGHSDVATTLGYAYATEEEMRRAVEQSDGGNRSATTPPVRAKRPLRRAAPGRARR